MNIEQLNKYNNWKKKWSNSDQMGLMNYISFNIHPEDLLLTSKIFFPDFIEKDNGVFIKENYSEKHYALWKEQLGDDTTALEKSINHIHIYDIFTNNNEVIADSIFIEIGKMLQSSWLMYVRTKFPLKSFRIDFENDENSYGPTLTLYQSK